MCRGFKMADDAPIAAPEDCITVSHANRVVLTALFDAAVAAADPYEAIKANVPPPPKGRTIVIGAGKGPAQLARAFEQLWPAPLSGVVVTRYGYDVRCERITVLTAAHPVPDEAGLAASKHMLDTVENLTEDDLVVALTCGGGSALLPLPLGDLTLDDEIAVNTALLSSGAPISVMNAIRSHFSAIKGGCLARAAHPARVVTLVVSDVPGDDPTEVASGPTIPSTTTPQEVRAFVDHWGIALTGRLAQYLDAEERHAPAAQDPSFVRDRVTVIASARKSLQAAAQCAKQNGITPIILSDRIEGETKEIAKMHAAIAAEVSRDETQLLRPVVLLSGGETTVVLTRSGKGGRNSEFALSLALSNGADAYSALVADTDGIDGSEANAGAFVSSNTAQLLKSRGLSPDAFLANHDSWSAFDALGDLFQPGPTGTNVNDFRAISIP